MDTKKTISNNGTAICIHFSITACAFLMMVLAPASSGLILGISDTFIIISASFLYILLGYKLILTVKRGLFFSVIFVWLILLAISYCSQIIGERHGYYIYLISNVQYASLIADFFKHSEKIYIISTLMPSIFMYIGAVIRKNKNGDSDIESKIEVNKWGKPFLWLSPSISIVMMYSIGLLKDGIHNNSFIVVVISILGWILVFLYFTWPFILPVVLVRRGEKNLLWLVIYNCSAIAFANSIFVIAAGKFSSIVLAVFPFMDMEGSFGIVIMLTSYGLSAVFPLIMWFIEKKGNE